MSDNHKTLDEIVKGLDKIKQGSSWINPHTHFEKMIQSHGLTTSDEHIIEFFQKAVNDDKFFDDENMPESTLRSKITGMISLQYILNVQDVRDVINDDALITKAVKVVEKMRKHYQTEYKQSRRDTPKQHQSINTKIHEHSEQLESEAHQIILDDDDTSSASVLITDDDIVSKRKIDMRVKHAIDMLEKYMTHEEDDFKKAFLEVIRDTIAMISKDI